VVQVSKIRKGDHFGISKIRVLEGIGDREFENKPFELPVRKIVLTVGSRGRTTSIDLLGSRTLVFWYFKIQHIGNPDDKERGVVKEKSRSRKV
jgi:hypothetical protein